MRLVAGCICAIVCISVLSRIGDLVNRPARRAPRTTQAFRASFLITNPSPGMSSKARVMADQSITLRSVAARAQVHPSTVSRALDPARRHLIADAVVARVETVARELGYRRNPIAASLRTR